MIEGQLKEKKGGRWSLFKKWKSRYFTLSGDKLTYKDTVHSFFKDFYSTLSGVTIFLKSLKENLLNCNEFSLISMKISQISVKISQKSQ